MLQLNIKQQPVLSSDTLNLSRDNDAAVQSQIDILTSPALARRVVEKLNFTARAEFNPALQPKTLVWKIKNTIKSTLGRSQDYSNLSAEVMLIQVTQEVMSRIQVHKDPLSYTVRISFTSRFARRAQLAANTLAEEYLTYQAEAFTAESRKANEWLKERVDELRQKVLISDRAVQNFSQRHGLFELDGKTLGDQQISELNAQLIQARTDLAQAQARLSRARQLLNAPSGIESVREVLNSGLIQALSEQEATLLTEKSELSNHFGPKHPSMQKINDEISDLRTKIATETAKIVKGLGNEAAISRVRVQTLEKELGRMQGKQGFSSQLEVQLDQLKREAEANHTLYESSLARLKETGEAENLEKTSARIISPAALPLSPSAPNKKLILLLFVMAGGACGVITAFLLEHFHAGFMSAEELEEKTDSISLGMVPEHAGTLAAQPGKPSIYTESLRSIMAGLRFSDQGTKPPKSVMVISSLPHEGKGWLAEALARTASESGKQVLLLDLDLHRDNSFSISEHKEVKMLNDYLAGRATLDDIIYHDEKTGMDFIPSRAADKNIQGLLESQRLKELMDFAREHYDLAMVDCPPVVGLSDIMFVSRLVDTAILIVRWNKTPRTIVQNALKTLRRTKVKFSGLVLTRMPLEEYKKHEFGDSAFDHDYLSESGNVVKLRAASR